MTNLKDGRTDWALAKRHKPVCCECGDPAKWGFASALFCKPCLTLHFGEFEEDAIVGRPHERRPV
jgi:hypothetical protein